MAKKKLKRNKQNKKINTESAKRKEKVSPGEYLKGHKSLFIIGGMLIALFAAFVAVFVYIITNYTVTTVYVEGNIHYTNEEIIDMVMEGHYGNNSLLLSLKYKDKSIVDVPFIEKMDVSVLDPNTIKIEVYEKALAGYVEYLERYMYFDKDGIVVESSFEKTEGVPMVAGLKFDYVVVHEYLPVENEAIFASILNITQLVNKYNLSVDRIYFGSDGSLTLYFDEVKAALGAGDNLDEKIMKLQYMLPSLVGKKGTLHMENYTEETKKTSFEPDKRVDETPET
ncbi:MAG: FtsQ-type POTRA domain-containing protein [Lachnospiraceae bacterium]|nr:FtsQ-type POTRA domain-containing protein [Lachnospiraceae bacterium]MDE6185265.1 FtsQ-type POTRA domain-containing protein [Lachnospiraceae bacterium]